MIARVTPGVPSQVVPAIMASPAGTPGQLTERQQLKMLLDETDPDRPAADEADEDDGSDPRVLFPAHGVGHPCAMLTWCYTSPEPVKKKRRKRKQEEYKVEEIVGMKVDSKTVRNARRSIVRRERVRESRDVGMVGSVISRPEFFLMCGSGQG